MPTNYSREYYQKHQERIKKYNKKWRKEHPDYRKNYYEEHKDYYEEHPEPRRERQKKYEQSPKGKESRRKWREEHPERIKILRKKQRAKRKQFGFALLNEWFEGCEGHHVDFQRVVYIPKEMHRSVWHSMASGIGMEEINKLAFDYLEAENKE